MALTKGQRETAYKRTNGRCAYCGCVLDKGNFHADHFVAQSIGGREKSNLIAACPDCNITKSNLSVEEFRKEITRIPDKLQKTMKGRMLKKYYSIKPKPVVFYFEKIGVDKWLKDECSQRQ